MPTASPTGAPSASQRSPKVGVLARLSAKCSQRSSEDKTHVPANDLEGHCSSTELHVVDAHIRGIPFQCLAPALQNEMQIDGVRYRTYVTAMRIQQSPRGDRRIRRDCNVHILQMGYPHPRCIAECALGVIATFTFGVIVCSAFGATRIGGCIFGKCHVLIGTCRVIVECRSG